MRILYFSQFDPLRPTTNRISDIRFCEGYVENGCQVEMITPYVHRHWNIKRSDIFQTYGIEHPFKITLLPTRFKEGTSKWITAPVWTTFATAAYIRRRLQSRGARDRMTVLSRDVNCLVPMLKANTRFSRGMPARIVFWAHDFRPGHKTWRWVCQNAAGVIATNSAIVQDVHASLGVPISRMAVSLNPVSTRQVRLQLDKAQVREELGLPRARPLVVYTGKLGPEMREIEHILSAAALLPEFTFLFTGGKPDAVRFYGNYCAARKLGNVVLTGFLDNYTQVQRYQVAADVLVSYYTSQNHLVDYNYPQKLTEYMLSGNPIVTPRYRATQDILTERNAIFVAPEDPQSLASGIRKGVEDRGYASSLAKCAYRDVQKLTFRRRTKHLLDFLASI